MNKQTKLEDLCDTSIQVNSLSVNSMTSLEIAELTGKQHKHVLTDIRNMLIELRKCRSKFGLTYLDAQGKERPLFKLPKNLTLTLASGYNIKMRHAIISRWEELERTVEVGNFSTQIQLDHDARSLSLKIIYDENQKIKSDINELSRDSSIYKRERNQATIDRDYLNDLKKSMDWDIKHLNSEIDSLTKDNIELRKTSIELSKEVMSLKSKLSVISESIINTVKTIGEDYE